MQRSRTVRTRAARKGRGRLFAEVFDQGGELVIYDARGQRLGVVRGSNGRDPRRRRARFFEMVRQIWERNRGIPPAVIEGEVARAVRAARARGSRKRG
ncbi:MAG TPA: hypothetical protein VFI25_05115 [Planctomycetota bacterium]|jgi:hypothetical protein|nr:hypothetical protein [Planctomycetota bacterium]